MKYDTEIVINASRSRVIELFDDSDNMKKWQPDLISYTQQTGEEGEPGSTAKIVYRMGKREMEMIETITVRNLPDEFSGIYKTDGVKNIMENFFEELDSDKTKWTTRNEFISDKFALKLMMRFMPGVFKKQTMKFMRDFKEFVEKSA